MRWWAPSRLRVRVDGLELRLPDDAQLDALASLAAAGVHDPSTMPFAVPWTDAEPDAVARSVVQWHWRSRAEWTPKLWSLQLAVLRDGEVLGAQDLAAADFAVVGEVSTGSWLVRGHQGQGTGRRMRAAVLALAFDHLGARSATTAAFSDNPASLAVTRALGYLPDGEARVERRGQPAVDLRYRLEADSWRSPWPVEIEGLTDELRTAFGAPAGPGAERSRSAGW